MRDRLIGFFRIEEEYRMETRHYTHRDGIYALVIYAIIMILYYVMGVIHATKNIYLGNQVNLFLALLCVGMTLIRKQPLKTIGISRKNLGKSFLLGFIPSVLLVTLVLIIGLSSGEKLAEAKVLFGNFMYFLFIIGLVEELLFRSYIQTRLYGFIRKPAFTILVTGCLFMLMHIPYKMGLAQMGFIEYISNNYITLLLTFLWHIVFRFLYAKYNSLLAPTLFHTFLNWTGYLFVS